MKRLLLKVSILVSLFLMLSATGYTQCVSVYDTTRAVVCRGDTFYFYGVGHTRTNVYYDTVPIAGGCDSIHVLFLTRRNLPAVTINQSICNGASYTFGGQALTVSGTYHDTIHHGSVYGCDSTVTLNLTVGGYVSTTTNVFICSGGSYLFYGQTLTVPGTYRDTVITGSGCDSIYAVRLAFYRNGTNTVNATICLGSSYPFHGRTLTGSGTYADTISGGGANGCDSFDVVRLTVTAIRGPVFRDTICFGSSIQVGSRTITTRGIYRDTVVTAGGCDSVVTYAVVVDSLPLPVITASGALLTGTSGTGLSYQWLLGNSPIGSATQPTYTETAAGSYTYTISDAHGCSRTSAAYTISGLGVIAEDANRVKVYPNPSSGTFVLETTDAIGLEAVVYDILGKVVESKMITKDKMNMQISAGDGIYLLLVKDAKTTIGSYRFTVSH